MPRRPSMWWSLLAFVAIAAFGAWWSTAGGDVSPPDRGGNIAVPASARHTAATPAPADAGASERAAVAPVSQRLPIPADARWCDVRVVDAATGDGIAGAEVVWLYAKDGVLPWGLLRALPPDEEERLSRDRELAARTFGSAATSDARGFVRVAVAPRGVRVHGTHGGRYGNLLLDADTEPPPGGFRLRLAADRELRVQVLDAAGRPAIGVPVRPVRDGDPERQNGSPIRYECARTEAPDGIARFPHLQERWLAADAGSARTWRMRVELPLLTDLAAPFDPWAPPAQPLVLQLPPTGQVLARTVFEGRLPDHRDTVLLFADDPQALRNENRAAWRTSEPDGWVCFRHVPLGQRFVARASLAGWVEQAFAGPVEVGETVRIEIEAPPDLITLAGRLVDAAGAPMRNVDGYTCKQWRFVDLGGGGSGGNGLRTDGDGRFRYLATRALHGDVEFTQLDFVVERADAPPLRTKLGPRTFAAGTTDLGDVVMAPGLPLVAGRLQFPPGVRPFQVEISVWAEVADEDDSHHLAFRAVEQVEDWQDADGRFFVFGDLPSERCELQIEGRRLAAARTVPFTPGQQDLVVPVDVGVGLWATLLLPPDLPHGVICILESASGAGARQYVALPEPGARGEAALRWINIEPGRYTLVLRLNGVRAPLLSIPDVDVPGPAGGDPRLLGIDLRPLVQVVTVRVTADPPFVDRLAKAAVAVPITKKAPGGWCGFLVIDGVARCVLPAGPQDLIVHCPDLQTVALSRVQGDITVSLQPWPEVALTFPDLQELPDGVSVSAMLIEDDEDRAMFELQPNETRGFSGGTVTLRVGPGRQRVLLKLTQLERSTVLEPDPKLRIRADAGYVEVRVDPLQLQRALGQIRPANNR